MAPSKQLVDNLLAAVEARELASLRWGYVHGSFSRDEVSGLAECVQAGGGAAGDPDELLEAAIDQRLILEFCSSDGTRRYRSRFAEGLRLLTTLRQIFKKVPWLTAPSLVSDYRVDARPRLVPRREIPSGQVITELGAQLPNDLARKMVDAVLHPQGREYQLSRFQLESARAVLEDSGKDRGIVISAGTGSGKTLAFYLPAIVAMGPWIAKGDYWVKVLAVYPRRELLKDQFAEAYGFARSVDGVLVAAGRRPIVLGTYFGLTPRQARAEDIKGAGWQEAGGGAFICPFLRCPVCQGEMVWTAQDLAAGREILKCRRSPGCSGAIPEGEVVLTRQSAQKRPPDIVFTIAETLNQRLSDTWQRKILGISEDPARRARMILLDEAHTYDGTGGAQAGLTLRRWRHAVGKPVRFVGLSATLREAPAFFSQLTGVPEDAVKEVAPSEADLDRVSMAYQVILRGDPVSQMSLLSASIQAAFLLARLMDPKGRGLMGRPRGRSEGRFGNRVFVYTDDLDVVNRLYNNLQDAEGRNIFGAVDPNKEPLASFRASALPAAKERDLVGQNWQACEKIGWDLDSRLDVTRTTSQDAGVAPNSNIVVATASLEVGFDDETVGAVLQHKSPHELASFVQRRGRAGRPIGMRPWMVTVLSDYGRDRLTYQSYEQLFDPSLPPQLLPVRNRYVLRMQAVFAFIDWMANLALTERHDKAWWWWPLNGPAAPDSGYKRQQDWVADILKQLLRGEANRTEQLAGHLKAALQLKDEEVTSLLWEPPRSLMLQVIPTLARRIFTEWKLAPGVVLSGGVDLMAPPGRPHPLPDFLPSSLFADLNLPEVTVVLPSASVKESETAALMPIVQALSHLAPGRVTRRFAYQHGKLNHWFPVPLNAPSQDLPMSRFAEKSDFVANAEVRNDETVHVVPIYRPWVIRLEKVSDKVVRPSSNARMIWRSELLPGGDELRFEVPSQSAWGEVIRSLGFYLHGFGSAVTARRFALGAVANLRLVASSEDRTVTTRFTTDRGEPAAVGFEQEVDGLGVRLSLPKRTALADRAAVSRELPAWRTAYFRYRVLTDSELSRVANSFQLDWMYQIYLSALIATAFAGNSTLEEARDALVGGSALSSYDTVMGAIFGVNPIAEDGAEERLSADSSAQTGRLQARMRELLSEPGIDARLGELAVELWAPEPDRWSRWLLDRTHETIGEALLLACRSVTPRHAALETLVLDLERGGAWEPEQPNEREVWITESSLGGAGVAESIAEAFAADQRVLFTALEAMLAPSDLELTSTGLDAFIQLVLSDSEVAEAVTRVRGSSEHNQRDKARAELYGLLARRGVAVNHAFSVALNHRLLREGTNSEGDQLVGELVKHWKREETRLGVSIELRVFSYLAATHADYGPRLKEWIRKASGATPSTSDMVGVLSGVLWPRPSEVRSRLLESYNPFRTRGRTDPAMARELVLRDRLSEVELGSDCWRKRISAELGSLGSVRLTAPRGQEAELCRELLLLIAIPVNVEFLQFYPVVEQVRRTEDQTAVTLILREFVSA
jgi:hypothetical protein